jgi:hypothetical protein
MRLFGLDITRARSSQPTTSRNEGRRTQSRQTWQNPYLAAVRQEIQQKADLKLYRLLRQMIPCLDTAINKLVLLLGQPEIIADEPLKAEMEAWMKGVKVNHLQAGFASWLSNHVDSMLWSGKAVGEIVPNNAGNDIYALTNLDPETIILRPSPDNPLDIIIAQRQTGNAEGVELDKAWLAVNLYNPGTDPHGVSLFRSLPFVSEILLTIEHSLRQTWERFGSPTFGVNWTAPDTFEDYDGAKTAAIMKGIEDSFVAAMEARKEGKVQDFFSTDVEVSVIGADGQVLDFKEPYEAIMQQIAGRTGLPYWMLGFPWGSTERLSTQQADVLISTLDGIWDELYPDLFRMLTLWRDMSGRRGEFEIRRHAATLQDAVESARADLFDAQAVRMRESTASRLWTTGIYTQEQYAEHVLGEGWDGEIATPMSEPPQPAMDQQDGNNDGSSSSGQSSTERSADHHTCTCHKDADAHVSFGQGEQPSDQRIADAVDGLYSDAVEAVGELRERTWEILRLPQPEDVQTRAAGFAYTPEQLSALDTAIDQFLTTMAGRYRTQAGFTAQDGGDGLIQQWDRFAHGLGVTRATEMTGAQAARVLPGRNSEAITNLLNNAFVRLSEGGQLRLEGQLDDLRTIIREGMDLGSSPIDVARRMGRRFDSYQGWEFQRLARTEIAFSQNAGLVDEFRAEGADTSLVDLSAFPAHPNCMCSFTLEQRVNDQGEAKWYVVYDISAQACSLCQAYAGR